MKHQACLKIDHFHWFSKQSCLTCFFNFRCFGLTSSFASATFFLQKDIHMKRTLPSKWGPRLINRKVTCRLMWCTLIAYCLGAPHGVLLFQPPDFSLHRFSLVAFHVSFTPPTLVVGLDPFVPRFVPECRPAILEAMVFRAEGNPKHGRPPQKT